MSWFHIHNWELIKEYFPPLKDEVKSMKNPTSDQWNRIFYGVTVATDRCVDCGKIKQHTFIGEVN